MFTVYRHKTYTSEINYLLNITAYFYIHVTHQHSLYYLIAHYITISNDKNDGDDNVFFLINKTKITS